MGLKLHHRYRCTQCGNLTRFDEDATRRTRRFLHFTLAGEPEILEEEIVSEEINCISCRWCGSADQIEQVPIVESE